MDPKERSAGIAQEALLNKLLRRIRRNEEQLFLVLTLVIGVVVGLTIVAFVVLTDALHRMGSSNMQELPVVSRRDVHKLEGIVALEDVLRLYGIGKSNWTTD